MEASVNQSPLSLAILNIRYRYGNTTSCIFFNVAIPRLSLPSSLHSGPTVPWWITLEGVSCYVSKLCKQTKKAEDNIDKRNG